jgi:hypothetical protein
VDLTRSGTSLRSLRCNILSPIGLTADKVGLAGLRRYVLEVQKLEGFAVYRSVIADVAAMEFKGVASFAQYKSCQADGVRWAGEGSRRGSAGRHAERMIGSLDIEVLMMGPTSIGGLNLEPFRRSYVPKIQPAMTSKLAAEIR